MNTSAQPLAILDFTGMGGKCDPVEREPEPETECRLQCKIDPSLCKRLCKIQQSKSPWFGVECNVPGCHEPVKSRALCEVHLGEFYRGKEEVKKYISAPIGNNKSVAAKGPCETCGAMKGPFVMGKCKSCYNKALRLSKIIKRKN